MTHWYNGRLHPVDTLPIAHDDPALLFGATVFTTLRVYGRSLSHPLTHWAGHCDRLHSSVAALGWTMPDWDAVTQGATRLAENPVLRVTLFPDGREWIVGRSLPADLATWQQRGIVAWVCAALHPLMPSVGRSLPLLKTGNYLAPWLARQQAQHHQANDAILVNAAGHWLETSTGNLWGWGDGQYWTPPLTDGILPGLARSHLISQLTCQNEKVVEVSWTADVISQLEAIAHCNSVVEVVPIRQVITADTARHYDPTHPALDQLKQAIVCPNP
jgi:branched-subunit amino acid aminotransferase/4-amino-4-deoxychorismate lyase